MDPHYQLDLVAGLVSAGVEVEVVGNDEMAASEIAHHDHVMVYNLRGDQRPDAPMADKALRLASYYLKLVRYCISTPSVVFHVQWPNKFKLFDRTVLCVFYKFLGKKLVCTAHNVNEGARDGNDSIANRFGLRVMYRLADHIIVHTDRSKTDITRQFNIHARKVSVIGFGVNRIVPKTSLSRGEAKQQLGLSVDDKALLFFGNVLPYKGLEYLLDAARDLLRKDRSYRVVIAGRNQLHEAYWREKIAPRLADRLSDSVICRTAFVRDEEVEVYFKAADVLVLPYLAIFQSAVLFVAYSFGLPVIASDVGAFRDDIAVGKTGYICSPNDVSSLKAVIGEFFAGPLYTAHDEARRRIARYAADKYSWDTVGRKTLDVYLHVTADTQRLTQAR